MRTTLFNHKTSIKGIVYLTNPTAYYMKLFTKVVMFNDMESLC